MFEVFILIDRNFQLDELSYYAINKMAMSRFTTYLSGRSQYVCDNNECSSPISVILGVAQGRDFRHFILYVHE